MAKKKRTKAQRREAALKSWQERKAREAAAKPVNNKIELAKPLPDAAPEIGNPPLLGSTNMWPPKVVYAVREGEDIFVCFGEDGSLRRERITPEAARKLLRELTGIVLP